MRNRILALTLFLFSGNLALADCPSADLTGDCFVDYEDFALMANQWLTTDPCDPCIPDDTVLIPGGTFDMGDSFDEGDSGELPVHTVTVDSFYMSKYEITNRQYCDFLNDANSLGKIKVVSGTVYASFDNSNRHPYCDTHSSSTYSQIDYSGGVFTVRTKSGRDMSYHPMVQVSWYGAAAYCNWKSRQEGYQRCYNLFTWNCDFSKKGYRLATEAEWEYAARGGLTGRRFPWGDTITQGQANYYSYWEQGSPYYPYDVNPTEGYHSTWNDGVEPYTSPVGSFAANGYGLYDMAGNVWEWCNDWYDKVCYDSSPTNNPTGSINGIYRVLRGGCWYDDGYNGSADNCRVAGRGRGDPGSRVWGGDGFRIVRALPECEHPAVEDVDDMEVYTPWSVPGNNIFETWRDGVGDCTAGNGNGTGSTVMEYPDPVLGGVQSMRYDYDNDGIVYNPCTMSNMPRDYLYSKAEAQIAALPSGIGSNWNPCGTTLLVVNFYGQPGNAVEEVDPLWVELKDNAGNSAKAVYGDRLGEDPQHLTEASWHEWVIDMADFAEDGVDVTDLASIAIGVGEEGATAPGGAGTLYFDEITLSTP